MAESQAVGGTETAVAATGLPPNGQRRGSAPAGLALFVPARLRASVPVLSGAAAVVRQFLAEWQLHREHRWYRAAEPGEALCVYSRLSPAEFDALNARQCWANWRLIPRLLHRRLPNRPLAIVDLGAGTGHSTEVLARCTPAGSRILAIEGAAVLAKAARERLERVTQETGVAIDVTCADILQPWHWADGTPVEAESIDLINSTGVIGHHLQPKHAAELVSYLAQRLRHAGLAALDPGPTMPPCVLRTIAQANGLCYRTRLRSNPLDLNGLMLFRKTASAP